MPGRSPAPPGVSSAFIMPDAGIVVAPVPRSTWRGDIGHPQIPIWIDEIGFAETVGLIDGTGQHREAKPTRYGFSLIRIATV